ncbi:MAG: lipopolysaccharide transport periplasmic protein LptA [Thermodesulfobacteriota bacterium]
MKLGKNLFLILILIPLALFLVTGEAEEKKEKAKGEEKGIAGGKGFGFSASRAPIDIVSDTVEANQKESTVTFKGNVVAKQEEATLYADTLVVRYESETKKLKEIIATGNVKLVQLDRRATSRKATFYQEANKVVLDGDAVVREGDNEIRGERVIFYVDEERSIVEGGKGGRVNTRIIPPPKEK